MRAISLGDIEPMAQSTKRSYASMGASADERLAIARIDFVCGMIARPIHEVGR